MSEDNENKKSGLTAGGVSGTKKMRLGRVHKKKTEDAPEAPAEEVKVEVAAPAPAPVEAAEEKPAKKTATKKAAKLSKGLKKPLTDEEIKALAKSLLERIEEN